MIDLDQYRTSIGLFAACTSRPSKKRNKTISFKTAKNISKYETTKGMKTASKDEDINIRQSLTCLLPVILEVMQATEKAWRQEKIYKTKGVTTTQEKILSQDCVCVVGVPGARKSTAIHHAALSLQNNGIIIYFTDEAREILEYFDGDTKQVFIFDDVFGIYSLKQAINGNAKKDESDYKDADNRIDNDLQKSCYLSLNHGNCNILSRKRTKGVKKHKNKMNKYAKNVLLLKDTCAALTKSNGIEETGIHLNLSPKIKTELPLVTDSESKILQFQKVIVENQKALSVKQNLRQQKHVLEGNESWIFSLRKPPSENTEITVFPAFQQNVDFILNRYFTPTPPSKRETMAYEMLRLCTLHDYPQTAGQSCIRLAQAAFYYEGSVDKVTCFSCGIEIADWLPDHVPMDRHRQLSPNCSFIQCMESGNVALSLAQTKSDTALGATGESATKQKTVQPAILIGDRPHGASNERSSDAGYSSASIQSHAALSTVSSGISVGKGSPSCDSGFVSQSSNNIGKSSSGPNSACSNNSSATSSTRSIRPALKSASSGSNTASSGSNSTTSVSHSSTTSGSVPVTQSLSSAGSGYQNSRLSHPSEPSTGASSLSRDSGYQTGTRSSSSSSTRGTSGYQTGSVTPSSSSSSTYGTTGTPTADTQSDPRYRITAQNKNRAHYPQYVLKTDRLLSFRNWPDYVQQTPEIMVESGFYFAGYEDCVRCFQCGIGLRNWEPPDNPHVEHARWSPRCPFLLSVKGQDFVNRVLDAVARLASRENDERTAASGNSSSSSNGASSTATYPSDGAAKNDVTDINITSNQDATKQTHYASTSADKEVAIGNFMDTEIVKNVLKLGYSKTDIKDAVKMIVNENSWTDATHEKIVKFLKDKNTPKTKEKHGTKFGGAASPRQKTLPPEIAELKNKNREMREMTVCKICLEEEVSIVFLPCGHLVACAQCAPALSRCAVCRKPITGTICAHLEV